MGIYKLEKYNKRNRKIIFSLIYKIIINIFIKNILIQNQDLMTQKPFILYSIFWILQK